MLLEGKVVEYIGAAFSGKVLLEGKVVEYIVEVLLLGKVVEYIGAAAFRKGAPFRKGGRVIRCCRKIS